jgi:hypothetical protein
MEALEAKHSELWQEVREIQWDKQTQQEIARWARRQREQTTTTTATATPSEPEFFDPVMGRL